MKFGKCLKMVMVWNVIGLQTDYKKYLSSMYIYSNGD